VLGITDLERSLDLYCGVLGLTVAGRQPGGPDRRSRTLLAAGGRSLVLELVTNPEPGGWVNDDLQCGIRHVAFKVDGVDRWAGRVRAAGMPFTMEPRDAFGEVRIAFFLDPDGAHLELVQGNVRYTDPGSPELVAAERAAAVPSLPRLDHVAVTVADPARTIDFYRRGAGAEVIGELRGGDDPRGFRITYLALPRGPGILEVFSFDVPLRPNPWQAGRSAPGLDRIGLCSADPATAAATLIAAGGSATEPRARGGTVVLDPDGTPLELAPGPEWSTLATAGARSGRGGEPRGSPTL